MSRLGTITRRSFIVGSVAVAGGVAFGTWEVTKTPPNPLAPEDGVALNPWLIVAKDGITVIVPRAEMGQGVTTTLAALVAEELEVPLETLAIAPGPPAAAYANEALLLPRGYDAKAPGALRHTLLTGVPRAMALQVTGGSTSTADAFDRMRNAGAAAREVLLLAGSNRLGLSIEQVHAETGAVVAPDGSRIAYTELAEDAARIRPPGAPDLKLPRRWTLLGRSQPRLDAPAKARGAAGFASDLRLPGMRFACIRMSPRRGPMDRFEPKAAQAMAGVEAVIDLGEGFAVVASNSWLAMQAADAVEVRWGAAPYPADTQAIFAEITKAFDDGPNIVARERGDVAAVTGGRLIEAEYRAPFLAHACMEPLGATALWEGDRLTLWTGAQAPVQMRADVAKALGIAKSKVDLRVTAMGGGFGRRSFSDFGVLAARVAKAVPGHPVQATWRREEAFARDYFRPGAVARMRARLDGARPAMLAADIASPSLLAATGREMLGMMPITPPDSMITEGAGDQPYAIDHQLVRGYAATLNVPIGAWRSTGNSQNAYFLESFIDELAHEAGADPLEFRLSLIRPEHEPSAKVLKKLKEISAWSGKAPAGFGRGVAFTHSFGTAVAEAVEVMRDQDGAVRLSRVWIAADPGLVLDPANVEAQLIGAAVFGLSAAIWGEVTFSDGMAEQANFPDYELLRMHTAPRFTVATLQSGTRPQGIGEPGLPPAAPALANALFDLTGKRARTLPLAQHFDFAV